MKTSYKVMVTKALTGETSQFTVYDEGLQAFKCANRLNFVHGHSTGDLYFVQAVEEALVPA